MCCSEIEEKKRFKNPSDYSKVLQKSNKVKGSFTCYVTPKRVEAVQGKVGGRVECQCFWDVRQRNLHHMFMTIM